MPGVRNPKYSTDNKVYRKNWDAIDWGTPSPSKYERKKRKSNVNIVIKVK